MRLKYSALVGVLFFAVACAENTFQSHPRPDGEVDVPADASLVRSDGGTLPLDDAGSFDSGPSEIDCASAPDGAACDDSNPCTTSDECQANRCVGTALDCSSMNDGCNSGSCDPATGACGRAPLGDGTACDDANPCTTSDECAGGTCAGTLLDCSSLSTTCATGTCNRRTGMCEAMNSPDGSACDDGSSCTSGDQCITGMCLGTPSCITTVDVHVANGRDDAMQDPDGTMLVNYPWASMYTPSHWGGCRFALSVPRGAVITAAWITFYLDSSIETYPTARIYGHAIDDAPQFAMTSSDISSRARTTAATLWDSGGVSLGGEGFYQTVPLIGVVQEVVNRAGWASGNRIAFMMNQTVSRAGSGLEWRQFDYGGGLEPVLHVEYYVP